MKEIHSDLARGEEYELTHCGPGWQFDLGVGGCYSFADMKR